MKILLIDIDSKIPNLALHKIATYYKDKGDEIIWNLPLMKYCVDRIYVSCVFDWNKKQCEEWEGIAEIGGSGYRLETCLPQVNQNGTDGSVGLGRLVQMLPTPKQRDWRSPDLNPESKRHQANSEINSTIGKQTGLKLQPAFVEWMMGFPQNWTDLNSPKPGIELKDCKPSGTQ